MTEDGAETEPAAPSRDTLASSTLRALRARRGNAGPTAPPTAPPTDEVPADEVPADEVPADVVPADESVDVQTVDVVPIDTEAADTEVESESVEPGPVSLAKSSEPAVDAPTELPVADEPTSVTAPTADETPIEQGTGARPRRGRLLTAVCAVIALAALVFAVVAGVVWWTAGHSRQHGLGVARDQVSTDARLAIVTVNTADYRHPSAALSNWLEVSTGSLHSQFSQSRSAAVKLIARAKTVTKANVLDLAVTSVDRSKNTASVIASVNVTRTHNGSNNVVRNRFRGTLTRVGGEWKLSNLTTVAVSLS